MSTPAGTWIQRLDEAMTGKSPLSEEALQALMGDTDELAPAVAEARAQKALLVWVKGQLDADLAFARGFVDKTGIAWLDKLLTVARLKELAGTRIVKAGKSSGLRYDIGGLSATYYGRKILDGLGLSKRRTSATREEWAQIREACARIKLTLPETVEPTTTERFFAEDP
ncbi:MAG: hypothetical protein KTR31_27935 [Myxococcales bacterium]|nr:hypothetical protein [Myxococcales bacterium]